MSAYSAHAELSTLTLAREDAHLLIEMHADSPQLCTYPISGDALALVNRGTTTQRNTRRKKAAAERRTA